MQFHLLSKQAGPISFEDMLPDLGTNVKIADAIHQQTKWNGNELLVQVKTSSLCHIAYVTIFAKNPDEVVLMIPEKVCLLHLSLEGSIHYVIEGATTPFVFHERSYNIIATKKLFGTASITTGMHRSMFLLITHQQLRAMKIRSDNLVGGISRILAGDTLSLARVNRIATTELITLAGLVARTRRPADTELLTKDLLEEAMAGLAASGIVPITLSQDKIDNLYELKATLKKNINKVYTLDDMVGIAGLTRSQIRRWFPMVFGVTAAEFADHYRMKLAAEYILDKQNYTMEYIAKQLGFKHQSAFTRLFKAHYKMTPRDFLLKCPNYYRT